MSAPDVFVVPKMKRPRVAILSDSLRSALLGDVVMFVHENGKGVRDIIRRRVVETGVRVHFLTEVGDGF